MNHSFLWAPDGTITTFDFPGAATGPGQGTVGMKINPAGEIVGNYYDTNSAAYGYVRAPDGKFTRFDVPGADRRRPRHHSHEQQSRRGE